MSREIVTSTDDFKGSDSGDSDVICGMSLAWKRTPNSSQWKKKSENISDNCELALSLYRWNLYTDPKVVSLLVKF